MNILNYTREQIQQLVRDGVAPVQSVRDWDIANQRAKGEKICNISHDNNVSRWQVRKILNKLGGN